MLKGYLLFSRGTGDSYGNGTGDGYGNGDGDGVKIRRYNPEDFRAICNEQFLKLIPPKKGK